MIVKLWRPQDGGRKWMLYVPGLKPDFFTPTPALERRMEAVTGYFHAERTASGWRIGNAAEPQAW
ncbi:MAG: hypothetical protein JO303_15990 [Caulobacteraceae bacterium]|nr:hypothetical protein [Caulobacteraceae bacterium]